MTHTYLNLRSSNQKTGPIPVTTTEASTCPPSCPLIKYCYAAVGPMSIHWRQVSAHRRGISWDELCFQVAHFPPGTLWRHNQCGDLPGVGNRINGKELLQLADANRGRRGFTYTHKPPTPANLSWIREANAMGFRINLSANTPAHADELYAHGLPVVTILPSTTTAHQLETPAGRVILVCPASYRDTTCWHCGLCSKERGLIIGFPAHGTYTRKIDRLLFS